MDKTSRKGRRQALRASLRSLLTAALFVTAYYVLPLDSAFTAGTVVALFGGVTAVTLLLVWQIRRIAQSPRPELRAAAPSASEASARAANRPDCWSRGT